MDKYEYNLKLEEIDKLVDQGDYTEAADLADTIDWRRVRNVRTLCLISEIYEAAGRLEEGKNLLIRAYRRSPVGRTVLYRLVEITTELKQYDEALEYYSEYVQVAPHDNNRYILKYRIYKGRGSQPEELIAILEEYLGQEYTERWAYELATLYQQTGQMQKCLATCDDLVLWFHSGKYVKKALELKQRFAVLTPKQKLIYEECLHESERQEEPDEETHLEESREKPVPQTIDSPDGEALAEHIIAQTEKEIGDQVSAHKAEMEKETAEPTEPAIEPTIIFEKQNSSPAAENAAAKETESVAAAEEQMGQENNFRSAVQEEQKEQKKAPVDTQKIPGNLSAQAEEIQGDHPAQGEKIPSDRPAQAEEIPGDQAEELPGDYPVQETEADERDEKDLKIELAKSMRKIISGVVKRTEVPDDDIPASVESRIHNIQRIQLPEQTEQVAGQLSIDDILLSMSDQGKRIADVVLAEQEKKKTMEEPEPLKTREEDRREEDGEKTPDEDTENTENTETSESEAFTARSVTEAAADELSDIQKEALQYTNHPERLLRNRSALPTYMEETSQEAEEAAAADEAETQKSEDLGKTRRIVNLRKELKWKGAIKTGSEDTIREAAGSEDSTRKVTGSEETGKEEFYMPKVELEEPSGDFDEKQRASEEEPKEVGSREEPDIHEEELEAFDEEENGEDYLTIPAHLRKMFTGFTEVDGLEDQIANAIIQAEAKGADRTSRSGNILIFGAHGSGKTTLAMNIAKAIAKDRGSDTVKMARIYAADLNRKDIAATVAKIAGGTLIIEEAGDLDSATVDQLTIAMEFRTDGLIVILEDEQQYIHELLMQHPRFTMKFTAQIYIPVYTTEELINFGQIYANSQDFVIGEEGCETLAQKIGAAAADGTPVSVSDVVEMVSRAIARSNKFFRKISMGKKRYDENDYIVLFPKDFGR